MDSVSEVFPNVVINHISVKVAATFSGYSLQYIHSLLEGTRLFGWVTGRQLYLCTPSP